MLILPIGDINKRHAVPYVNYLLIVANVAAFAWSLFLAPHDQKERIVQIGLMVPDHWTVTSVFASMFLHANLLHLGGNMLFLWIAGDNVEDRMGHLTYLAFYLLCGVAGAAAHIYMALGPMISMHGTPTLGASGAISGVIGAYLIFYPASKIKFMIWLIIFIRYFTLPSWAVIGFWIGSQVLMAREQLSGKPDVQMEVAVFAHLGGFALGLLVGLLFRLFGKPPPKPSKD